MRIVIHSDIVIFNGNNPEPNDDYIFENDEMSYGITGVVLNDFDKNEIPRILVDGSIQRKLKGNYAAWFYDKSNKRMYIANDLLSKQSVYYYYDNGLLLINTSLLELCKDLRANGRFPQVNLDAILYFLNNYVFCGDMTYEKNTFFLTAYSYIEIDCEKKSLEVKRLPIPNIKTKDKIKDELVIDKMEQLFTEACEAQWKKNEDYKKDQLFTISGGMDSRAVLLHMLKLRTNSNIQTYTYAQSGSTDETIAKRTAKKLNVKHVFIPLDNCEFAYLKDEIIEANEGQMYYIGSTGAILMAKSVQKEITGIVHTGLGGGEILGDACSAYGDTIQDQNSGLTINQQRNLDDIRKCLNFQKTTSRFFYAFSPFLYEDFFEYVMCLPATKRLHRKIYIKWYRKHMNADFPSAACYSYFIKAINRVKVKLYLLLGKRNPADMNPIQYWYDTYPQLRKYIENSWKHDCEMLYGHEELLEILSKSYNENDENKFAVLTVTGIVLRILGRISC